MVGDENATGTFVPTAVGQADFGQYYASASFAVGGSDGGAERRVVWAWVTEARGPPYGGSTFAGVQALPREISIGPSGACIGE